EPVDVKEVLEVVKAAKLITEVVTTAGATKVSVPRKRREAQARRNMIVYLKNMAGYKIDYFKEMSYNEIRPLFEKHYSYNQAFLDEVHEGVIVLDKEVRQEKEV
nr:hypothetical protein [Tanacetum cinerariifolium]